MFVPSLFDEPCTRTSSERVRWQHKHVFSVRPRRQTAAIQSTELGETRGQKLQQQKAAQRGILLHSFDETLAYISMDSLINHRRVWPWEAVAKCQTARRPPLAGDEAINVENDRAFAA